VGIRSETFSFLNEAVYESPSILSERGRRPRYGYGMKSIVYRPQVVWTTRRLATYLTQLYSPDSTYCNIATKTTTTARTIQIPDMSSYTIDNRIPSEEAAVYSTSSEEPSEFCRSRKKNDHIPPSIVLKYQTRFQHVSICLSVCLSIKNTVMY